MLDNAHKTARLCSCMTAAATARRISRRCRDIIDKLREQGYEFVDRRAVGGNGVNAGCGMATSIRMIRKQ